MARDFHLVAEQVIDDLLAAEPDLAQWSGDHRHDHRLPDYSDAAVRAEVDQLRESVDVLHEVDPDHLDAEAAVDRHGAWLRQALATPGRDPRLGRRKWEAKLWHSLDSGLTAGALLDRAEVNLMEVGERIREVATELTGTPDARDALDALAADHPDDSTILASAETSLAAVTNFVRERDLLSLVDDPCVVV